MTYAKLIAVSLAVVLCGQRATAAEYPYSLPEETPTEQSAKHCASLYSFLLGTWEEDAMKLRRTYSAEWKKRTNGNGEADIFLEIQHRRKITDGLLNGTVNSSHINGSLYQCAEQWKVPLPDNVSQRIVAGLKGVRDEAAFWEGVRNSPEGQAAAARQAARDAADRADAEREVAQAKAQANANVNAQNYAAANRILVTCQDGYNSAGENMFSPAYTRTQQFKWVCKDARSEAIKDARAAGDGANVNYYSNYRFPWE